MDSRKDSDLINSHAESSAGEILMKQLFAVSLFGFVVIFNSFSAPTNQPPTSAEQLRSEFETALKANNTNAVLSLVNWKGVSDQMKSDVSMQMVFIAGHGVANVKLLPLPTDRQLTNEFNGVRYYPNVHVEGLVDVELKAKGNNMQIPYGESSGIFYIAGTIQETFDAHAKSTPLAVMVTGLFPKEDPGILTCSYVYVSAGKERIGSFRFTNTWNISFWGDYIKSCKVTKVSGTGSYELKIDEANKTVFDSDMVETNDIISYEKTN
jgi:hypothetical protein